MEPFDPNLTYVRDALEQKKRIHANGNSYWLGREIMEILGYRDWRDFIALVERAKDACNKSGNFSNDHFVHYPEMIEAGKGAQRERENFKLSKYACHLITMNGDSSKPQIATAQTYFAVQTHKQEIEEALPDLDRRLLVRNKLKNANRRLNGAARAAGVRDSMFGVFHDAGYQDLYGGIRSS